VDAELADYDSVALIVQLLDVHNYKENGIRITKPIT